MALKRLTDMDFEGKNVIARFDFNVPIGKDGEILDTSRIDSSLPTINYLLKNGVNKLVLMSHLGRPNGKFVKELSLEPVAAYLSDKLEMDVTLTETAVDRGIKQLLSFKDTKIVLLQNLRFHKEEEENGVEFAKTLASYGDIYVNDAFSMCHRVHASVHQIVAYFKNACCAGFLVDRELSALGKITENPDSPFIAIMGGKRVSEKIKIIDRMLPQVSSMIIAGAMTYPFLKAKGYSVGTSFCLDEDVELAKKILQQRGGRKILLPMDHIVSSSENGTPEHVHLVNIPDDKMGLDIGPHTILQYEGILKNAKTILWNGPVGYFENPNFSKGTFALTEILSKVEAFTVIGGADSAMAAYSSGKADRISHVSTGGTASLEFLENGQLPAINALKFGIN